MNILGIDTSSLQYIIAIEHDTELLSRLASVSQYKINPLPSMVKASLREIHLSLQDIDYFSIVLGPGSFTGLRMGCAFMQGLTYACMKPVVGLSNLALHAMSAEKVVSAKEMLVTLKVNHLGYYIGRFVQQESLYEQFSETLPVVSEGVAKIGDAEGFLSVEKSAEAMMILANKQISAQCFYKAEEVMPRYLYQPIYRTVGNFNG